MLECCRIISWFSLSAQAPLVISSSSQTSITPFLNADFLIYSFSLDFSQEMWIRIAHRLFDASIWVSNKHFSWIMSIIWHLIPFQICSFLNSFLTSLMATPSFVLQVKNLRLILDSFSLTQTDSIYWHLLPHTTASSLLSDPLLCAYHSSYSALLKL